MMPPMKRLHAAITIAGFTFFMTTSSQSQDDPAGSLTPDFIKSLQADYKMDAGDRARFNAISGTDLKTLALNREIVSGEDGHFSHKIKTKGITNQKSSGRCWMFAGFNVMRPGVIHELGLDAFEFSGAHLLFWDKMEKSNLYFEQVIELRNVDRLDREWQLINEAMVGDGGWWNYVSSLIEKYGVVPSSVMPETHASSNTREMNAVLKRLLRSRSAAILKAHQNGEDVRKLRKLKTESMAEVYRFLALNLGEPPTEFEWRYQSKKKKSDSSSEGTNPETGEESIPPKVSQDQLSERKRFTPQSFYEEFVGVDLSQYVTLYHDPALDKGEHYRFNRARNIVGSPEMDFVNTDIELIKKIAVESIKGNQPLWFAVNMGPDQSKEHGLMEKDLFAYETLFGIEMPFSKADRSRFNAGASNHAMILTGVDIKEGKPCKWLVENSWGTDRGKDGTWTLYDAWFDEHVYTVTVQKDLVPAETLAAFEKPARQLPTWYPGAMGIPGN